MKKILLVAMIIFSSSVAMADLEPGTPLIAGDPEVLQTSGKNTTYLVTLYQDVNGQGGCGAEWLDVTIDSDCSQVAPATEHQFR